MNTLALLLMLLSGQANISNIELKLLYINPNTVYRLTISEAKETLARHEWGDVQYGLYVEDFGKDRQLGLRDLSGMDPLIEKEYQFLLNQCMVVIRSLDLKNYKDDISTVSSAKEYPKEVLSPDHLVAYGEFVEQGTSMGTFALYWDDKNHRYSEYANLSGYWVQSPNLVSFVNHILSDRNIKDEYVFSDKGLVNNSVAAPGK